MDLRPDIALETAAEGDLAVVRLAGELDAATSPILRPKLLEEATRPAETTLDLEALRFCDAAGLRLLVEVTRQARAAGGSVRLRHLRPAVARVVEVTRCDQFLDIDDEP